MKRIKAGVCFFAVFAMLLCAAVMPFAENFPLLPAENTAEVTDKETALPSASAEVRKVKAAAHIDSSEYTADETGKKASAEEHTGADIECASSQSGKDYSFEVGESTQARADSDAMTGSAGGSQSFYSYFPGDEREEIFPLSLLSDNRGRLTGEKSVNTYIFSLSGRGMLRYTLAYTSVGDAAGFDASLYQEYFLNGVDGEKGYRLVNVLSGKASENRVTSSELGLIQGDYRIVVTPARAIPKANYSIRVKFTPGGGYEAECNDNVYRYTEIYGGVPIKGSASKLPGKTDDDFYMFRMSSGGCAELTFSHEKSSGISVCWQVSVFDESSRVLFSSNSHLTDTVLKSGKIGLDAGIYFISVKNRIYTDMPYTLSLDKCKCDAFEREFNDSLDSAQPVVLNSSVSGSLSRRSGGLDFDYFSFEINQNGYVSLDFSHRPLPEEPGDEDRMGWRVTLFDAEFEKLYSGCSGWRDDIISTPLTGLRRGKYFVAVDADYLYSSSETYTLRLNFNQTNSWEKEFNNSFKDANPLSNGIAVSGTLVEIDSDYDVDCYTFNADETRDVSLIFSHEKRGSDRDIFAFTLYDEKANAVGFTDENGELRFACLSTADDEKTVAYYKNLPAGKYYIKVTTGKFFDNIRYTLLYRCERKDGSS